MPQITVKIGFKAYSILQEKEKLKNKIRVRVHQMGEHGKRIQQFQKPRENLNLFMKIPPVKPFVKKIGKSVF